VTEVLGPHSQRGCAPLWFRLVVLVMHRRR
jgi:hypothetical protein